MRFLLKPSSSSIIANRSQTSKILASAASKVGDSTGKAWGQQCSSNCGCVLRIEAQLSESSSSGSSSTTISPTIVQATYHAKRVMATTTRKTTTTTCNNDNDTTRYLKPLLTTQQSKTNTRPILTACTCPTLHHLAQQIVDHLPGKTLAQMRNEVDMGTVGSRSSVAFRHTVLKENVLPSIAGAKKQYLGITTKSALNQLDKHGNTEEEDTGVHEMNLTHRHGHCYDLVEGSLLSMIHERMPTPRNDTVAESYSPTLGGHFRLYSSSGRKQPIDDIDDLQQDESAAECEDELSFIHEAGDWQRRGSPSSFFLFGDDSNGNNTSNSLSMTGMFIQHLLGNESKSTVSTENASEEHRPTTTYLQLLDMYGEGDTDEKDEEPATDDWLEYVDQMRSQYNRSSTA